MVAISYHCFLDVLEFRNVGIVVDVAAVVVAMVAASVVVVEDDTMVV